jgi:hypothetical protein
MRWAPQGIFVAPFEQDEIGPDLFRAAVFWEAPAHHRGFSRAGTKADLALKKQITLQQLPSCERIN